jgi:hypothetical protein
VLNKSGKTLTYAHCVVSAIIGMNVYSFALSLLLRPWTCMPAFALAEVGQLEQYYSHKNYQLSRYNTYASFLFLDCIGNC